jgi:hypothetical protein
MKGIVIAALTLALCSSCLNPPQTIAPAGGSQTAMSAPEPPAGPANSIAAIKSTQLSSRDPLEGLTPIDSPPGAMTKLCRTASDECFKAARTVEEDTSNSLDERVEAVGNELWVTRTMLVDCSAKPDELCKGFAHTIEQSVDSRAGFGLSLYLTKRDQIEVMALIDKHIARYYNPKTKLVERVGLPPGGGVVVVWIEMN